MWDGGYSDAELAAEYESGVTSGRESVLTDLAELVSSLDKNNITSADFILQVRNMARGY